MIESTCPNGHDTTDNVIGMELPGVGVLVWRCKTCGALWPRYASGPQREQGEAIIATYNEYKGKR